MEVFANALLTGLYKGICFEVVDTDATFVSLDIEGERYDIPLVEASLIEVLTTEEALQEMKVNEMSTGAFKELAHRHRHHIDIALVGQPLSGKNSLFATAIGGNYNSSTSTNEIQTGERDFQDYHLHITNLPNTYSLTSRTADTLTVRNHLINDAPDVVICVIDATDLERSMQIATQLLDMNLRVIVALNKFDAMQDSGARLDYQMLSRLLGTPVVPTISIDNDGLEQLLHLTINIYEGADFLDEEGEINKEVMRELQEWHRTIVHKDDDSEHTRPHARHPIQKARLPTYTHLSW